MDDLKDLVDQYVISLELGQHSRVSELSPKIRAKLVYILDDHLAELDGDAYAEEDDKLSSNNEIEPIVQAIGSICDRIRKYEKLAVAYRDVRSFVDMYDMICLSRMSGLTPPNTDTEKQPEHRNPISVDRLAYIMRSACFLLRYMHEGGENQHDQEESPPLWINAAQQIDKIPSVSFPQYLLKLPQTDPRVLENVFAPDRIASTMQDEQESDLSQVLSARWFSQFLEDVLYQSYPMDRFSCLVALWIIADLCRCDSLQQMMSELVDQIYHEESNSCNLEELLQLGAGGSVGSFWLSYHRRYRSTFSKATSQPTEDDNEDEDEEEDQLSESLDGSVTSADYNTNEPDSRVEMRRLIRDELLEGPECLLCGARPKEPLTCLQNNHSCHQCGTPTQSHEVLALSHRRLPLLRLDQVSQLKKCQRIVLITPSEWVRRLISTTVEPEVQQSPTRRISERIEIEPNFERLTISRDEEVEPDSFSSLVQEDEESLDELSRTLKLFFDSPESSPATNRRTSESIRMLRFTRRDDAQGALLPLYSSDFLLVDSMQQQQVQVRLATSDCLSCGSAGSWLICNARSPFSKLMIGCQRWFSSLEMSCQPRADCCPFCQELELRRVVSFPGELQLTAAAAAAV